MSLFALLGVASSSPSVLKRQEDYPQGIDGTCIPVIDLGDADKFVITVSHLQGTIDWPTVAADGIAFAYIKATEGVSKYQRTLRHQGAIYSQTADCQTTQILTFKRYEGCTDRPILT